MNSPFLIIPWNVNFIERLTDCLLERTNGRPGSAVLVFPHGRPGRYVLEALRRKPGLAKPCLLPRMFAVRDLFARARQVACGVRREPGLLDQVAVMQACVAEVARNAPMTDVAWPEPVQRLHELLKEMGPEGFFPWGTRLVNLVEEFWTHGREPEDYQYMAGEASPFAAMLLANLGRIHEAYAAAFEERGWTSPGYDALCSARSLQGETGAPRLPHLLDGLFQGSTVFIAGFAALSGAEEILLKRLWDTGGIICLHTDPAVLPEAVGSNGRAHWSSRVHSEWMKRWKARGELYGELSARVPRVEFHEGYDLHSQLSLLPGAVEGGNDAEARGQASTAVALPDTGLLLPVLHHMPDKEINISMGYPFERSALARLVESLLKLQESRLEAEGPGAPRYARRPFIECIRHPYLRMLGGESPENGGGSLRRLLHRLEGEVARGQRLVNPRDLAALVLERALREGELDESSPDRELFLRIVDACLTPWEEAQTPAGLAAALTELCALLLERGGRMWERFALDAECLFLLMQRVVPDLRDCEAARTELGRDILFTFLRELLAAQRVPFEAEPLTGVQVLGMLETRLLCFDRVILLDATEDKLPGAGSQDPLLPESLRGLAGLPDAAARDRVAAYNFFRLIASADEAVLFYQAGETQTGLFDEKKTASRFVEELIWREELRNKRLLGPDDAPRHAVRQQARPFFSTPASIPKSPAVQARLAELLEKPLSPSMLNVYLQCPVRFFHSGLARLKPLEQADEGPDPAGVGDLLHESLRRFYEPRLGLPFTPEERNIEELRALFLSLLAQSDLPGRLPPDSLLMLETAGPERLRRYLLNQPPGNIPLRVEAELTSELAVDGRLRTLTGRVDRVDQRETPEGPKAMLIDYKSGSVRLPERGLWTDDAFWQRLTNWRPDGPYAPDGPSGADPLPDAAERVASLQLPCYLHLYGASQDPPAWDAALAELRDNGLELTLFKPNLDEPTRQLALEERIPALLRFVLRHMEQAPAFLPNPGRQCDWCFCSQACKSAVRM